MLPDVGKKPDLPEDDSLEKNLSAIVPIFIHTHLGVLDVQVYLTVYIPILDSM